MKVPSKNTAYLALIFAAALAIVVYFMPRDSKHKYSYELNRPWNYDLLTAPFDIPVYRDSATVKELIDSVDRTFVPIYRRDNTALERLKAIISDATNLTPHTRTRLLRAVTEIYGVGVVDAPTAAMIDAGKLPEMTFNEDNIKVGYATDAMVSQRDAYALIDSVFRDSPERAEVQKLGLSNLLEPSLVEDRKGSEQYRETLIQPIVSAIGVVQKGERIIDRGDRVSPRMFQVLKSYELALDKAGRHDRNRLLNTLFGQTIFVICIFAMLYTYFALYYPEVFANAKQILAVMILMVGMFIFTVAMSKAITGGQYIVPLAMLPVIILVFFDSRTAFFVYVGEVLLCTVIASFQLEFVFVEMLAGTAVTFSLKELSRRSQLLRTAMVALFTYLLGYVAVELMFTGSLSSLSGRLVGFFAINSVLISFAYLMIFIFEKLFGMISVVTLVELSDINNPVLRKLSTDCPGTFQHSMAVSNLASEAAHNIGANVQLVRAGALYHDIGKIDNPAFFTENQYGVNPHDVLTPKQSARIIISHVTDGCKRADKAKLPQVIKDFITQHHGKGRAKYFYIKEQQAHPDEDIDPAPFTYPGPNPQTREASVLMMADSVEAASRSLTDHSEAAISGLVNRLIDQQVADGLHNQSPLSFRDISKIKETFIKRLRSMYHGRVQYPPETRRKPSEAAPAVIEAPAVTGVKPAVTPTVAVPASPAAKDAPAKPAEAPAKGADGTDGNDEKKNL